MELKFLIVEKTMKTNRAGNQELAESVPE